MGLAGIVFLRGAAGAGIFRAHELDAFLAPWDTMGHVNKKCYNYHRSNVINVTIVAILYVH